MRIRYLEDTLTRVGLIPAGTEDSVQPEVGVGALSDGTSLHVDPLGFLGLHPQAPSRDGWQQLQNSSPPAPFTRGQ